MLFNFATLQLGQYVRLWVYTPLTVDRRMHKIVARDQRQRAHASWNLRPERHSNIEVIEIPVLVNQSWKYCCENIFVIARDPVKVLPCKIQSRRRIPGGTNGIFLAQRIGVLIQWDFFVEALKLIDFSVFLFPFAFEIEEPIFDTGVTHLQPLGETVVI